MLLRGLAPSKSMLESGESSRHPKSPLLSSNEKSKFHTAIQSLYRVATDNSTSPRESGMNSPRKGNKRFVINRNRGVDMPPEQVVLEGIRVLEQQAAVHGQDIQKQIGKRLDELKQAITKKNAKLSLHCRKEQTQLQKISQLLHLHTMTEERFQKRLEEEKRARDEIVEDRVNAASLLCEATKAGQAFTQIGENIRYLAKGHLNTFMVRDAIRKLPHLDPEQSETSRDQNSPQNSGMFKKYWLKVKSV